MAHFVFKCNKEDYLSLSLYLHLRIPYILEWPVVKPCLDAWEELLRINDPEVAVQPVDIVLNRVYAHTVEPVGHESYSILLMGKQGLVDDRVHLESACHAKNRM